MKIYKIRHKVTGLFSKGGISPFWSKKGKTWNTFGHLKRHLRAVFEYRHNTQNVKDLENWEIIEIEVTENSKTFDQTPYDIIRAMAIEKVKQEQKRDYNRAMDELKKQQAIAKLTPEERRVLNL
jgi:hypothetical protein